MNQKFLSNQEVFNSIQSATIKVEPDFKSTILYSNQFASENPVSPTGELQQILDSQIGSAGTNVLIQLKQKMLALAGGPWYMDIINGIIHIHNRRYTSQPSSYYAYQSENGELLSASFRLVDVYKNHGAMRSFVNNLTKGLQNFVGALTSNINDRLRLLDSNIKEQSLINSYAKEGTEALKSTMKRNLTHEPDKTRVDRSNVKAESEAARKLGLSNDAWKAKFKTRHMTEAQKRQLKQSRIKEVSSNYDIPSSVKLLRAKYKDVDMAWKEYEAISKNPLASNKEREEARQYALNYAKKYKVLVGRTRKYDDGKEFSIKTTVYVVSRHMGGGVNAQYADSGDINLDRQIQKEVNKKAQYYTSARARDGWKFIRYVKGSIGKPVQKKATGLELFKAGADYVSPVTVYLYFTGYRDTDVYMDGSRVLSGLPRIQPPTPTAPLAPINVGNFLNNAHNNFGKQKKEVRLEGTLLVIGNPHLETGQQLHLSNVSKAYSGLWYIAKVVHKLEPSSGYTSECTIMRQMPEKRSDGEAELTTVENTDNKPKGEANKITGTSPSRHPKPTPTQYGSRQVTTATPTSGDTKTTTVMFNPFEKYFMATQVKALSTREDVVSVTSRTATDIAVTKAVTGKSPVKVNPKTGAVSIDRQAIDLAKIKAQRDPNVYKKVQKTGGIKATTDRVLTRWVRSRGHKN